MGDGFAGIPFALTIWRNDEQRHFALLECGPAVMSIAIDPVIAGDQDRVPEFPPFHTERTQKHILLDRLSAVLA